MDWTRCIVDADAFRHEQRCLAHVWTFLGLTADVAHDGDWFTASIATRSVFVQRFGTELRAFENICAHRGYPLRHADRGNGPLVCGYHHWHYDRDGRAAGIPHCRDLFGALPQELGARLNRVELALCGTLIFGRFASAGGSDTLEAFLGDGFDILQAMSQMTGRLHHLTMPIAANWRLCMHITLDDYHAPAVHPTSFGKTGYLLRKNIGYFRFGLHSAFLNRTEPDAFDQMLAQCRAGSFQPTRYSIFQVLPNLLVALFRTDGPFFYGTIQVYDAVRHDRTRMRAWLYPAPFTVPLLWLRKLTDPLRMPIVRHVASRISREDNEICERLQGAAHQLDIVPRLGKLEERIDWFEEAYRQLIASGQRLLVNDVAEATRSGATGR